MRFSRHVSEQGKQSFVESEQDFGPFSEKEELDDLDVTLLPVRINTMRASGLQVINTFSRRPELVFTSPVFDLSGTQLIVSDEFNVQFKPSISREQIEAINKTNHVEIVKKFEELDWYVMRVKDPSNMNALKTANRYYESDVAVFSKPNFIRTLDFAVDPPEDEYYSEQWYLDTINALEGWDISTGSSSIVIAILDNGVDVNHVDLSAKIVDPCDCVDGDFDPFPDGNEYHGTACAGIAAAVTDVNEEGVAGVAWNCKIMPIRMGTVGAGEEPWTTDSWVAGAFDWAGSNGADVINCSWTGPNFAPEYYSAVCNAKYNHDCVIVWASGNDARESGGKVGFLARHKQVIAVGATTASDTRWIYSQYGPELDVVAPSEGIWTTDITGSAGANNSSDPNELDYTDSFGGTSAAAPQVAGLAALVLSVDNSLTSDEVQYIIESTAYDITSTGTGWDEETGWGRIDVNEALVKSQDFSDERLESCWEFDTGNGTTAEDSSGDNDGTISGASWTTGRIGDYALSFNGVNDKITLDPVGALSGDDITIFAWIKVDTSVPNDSNYPIIDQNDYDPYYNGSEGRSLGYDLCLNDSDKLVFYLHEDNEVESNATIETGTWIHVAATYDDSYLKVYINGDLSCTPQSVSNGSGISCKALIGYDGIDFFDGCIDDVRVYNYAWTANDIEAYVSYLALKVFVVENSSNEDVAWINEQGDLYLTGTLTESGTPTASGSDEFRIKDSNDTDVAIINLATGNMVIAGAVYEERTSMTGANHFIVKDSSGNAVAYIDDDGNLYLTGKVYETSQ